jgi:hypothetical protein
MDRALEEFQRIVVSVLTRFCGQLCQQCSAGQLSELAFQLSTLVAERGLPRALGVEEMGAPGGMSEEECAPLVARLMNGLDNPLLADAARQLIKACFYPEFKACRNSFRELARDGSCRRQQVERARNRLSGTHCVDCPHWVALTPDEHVEYLKREWRTGPAEFVANQEIFLPEDFRELRQWLHRAARLSADGEGKDSSQC